MVGLGATCWAARPGCCSNLAMAGLENIRAEWTLGLSRGDCCNVITLKCQEAEFSVIVLCVITSPEISFTFQLVLFYQVKSVKTCETIVRLDFLIFVEQNWTVVVVLILIIISNIIHNVILE